MKEEQKIEFKKIYAELQQVIAGMQGNVDKSRESLEKTLSILENITLKPVQIEFENNIGNIDTGVDILKFIIPFIFSVWIVIQNIPIYNSNSWILVIVLVLLITVLIVLFKLRVKATKEYNILNRDFYIEILKAYNELMVSDSTHIDHVQRINLEKAMKLVEKLKVIVTKKDNQ